MERGGGGVGGQGKPWAAGTGRGHRVVYRHGTAWFCSGCGAGATVPYRVAGAAGPCRGAGMAVPRWAVRRLGSCPSQSPSRYRPRSHQGGQPSAPRGHGGAVGPCPLPHSQGWFLPTLSSAPSLSPSPWQGLRREGRGQWWCQQGQVKIAPRPAPAMPVAPGGCTAQTHVSRRVPGLLPGDMPRPPPSLLFTPGHVSPRPCGRPDAETGQGTLE